MPPWQGQCYGRLAATGARQQTCAALSGTSFSCWTCWWLGNLDSNQDKQSQSLLCYRYTIPQYFRTISIAYIGKRLLRMRSSKPAKAVAVLLPAPSRSWQAGRLLLAFPTLWMIFLLFG